MKHNKQILILGMIFLILLLFGTLIPQKLALAQPSTNTNTPTVTIAKTSSPTPTIKPIPTINATQTILEKLQLENEKLQHENDWWWSNGSSLLATLIVLFAAWLGFRQWQTDHRISQAKREEDYRIEQAKLDEERFQKVVEGLGSEIVEARVGAAIMLLTFLRPGYEKFYSQTFLLAVAHLRLRKADPETSEPLDAMSQAVITVFREAFSKARDNIENNLDAAGVHMDNAYLSKVDLRRIRVRNAFFRYSVLWEAQLQKSYFKYSNLIGARMGRANLAGADFSYTMMKNANLEGADFENTHLTHADLDGADLTNTNLELAKTLRGTILRNVKGLSREQLAICAAKGAIIDVIPDDEE